MQGLNHWTTREVPLCGVCTWPPCLTQFSWFSWWFSRAFFNIAFLLSAVWLLSTSSRLLAWLELQDTVAVWARKLVSDFCQDAFSFGHAVAFWILVPTQGSTLGPLQWKYGVLTTGLPGMSHQDSLPSRATYLP